MYLADRANLLRRARIASAEVLNGEFVARIVWV